VAVAALRAHRRRQDDERNVLGPDYADGGLVFCTATGSPLLPRWAVRQFKRATERAGLPTGIRFYDLRHGNATAMLVAGVAPKAAAERLGHSSVVLFNDTYAHMLQEIDADAAAKLEAAITGRRRPAAGAGAAPETGVVG
jgi:integrase